MKPKSLGDEAYRRLRDAIVAGDLPDGAPLREDKLAAELGLSRTPVRDALRRLEADGLVEIASGRGASVKVVTREDALALVDLYWVLGRHALETAAQRLTDPELDRIQAWFQAARTLAPADRAGAQRLVETAWEAVYEAAGNREITRVLDSIRPRLERLVAARYPERIEATFADNEAIVAAVRAGAVEEALSVFDRSFAVALDLISQRTGGPGDAASLP